MSKDFEENPCVRVHVCMAVCMSVEGVSVCDSGCVHVGVWGCVCEIVTEVGSGVIGGQGIEVWNRGIHSQLPFTSIY